MSSIFILEGSEITPTINMPEIEREHINVHSVLIFIFEIVQQDKHVT